MVQNNACIFQKTQKTWVKVAQREFGLLFLVSMLHIINKIDIIDVLSVYYHAAVIIIDY